MKKYVTKSRGKKFWLTPLAFLLIFSLVICPIASNVVYADETDETEASDVIEGAEGSEGTNVTENKNETDVKEDSGETGETEKEVEGEKPDGTDETEKEGEDEEPDGNEDTEDVVDEDVDESEDEETEVLEDEEDVPVAQELDGEDEGEENDANSDALDAFWQAAGEFWQLEESFWKLIDPVNESIQNFDELNYDETTLEEFEEAFDKAEKAISEFDKEFDKELDKVKAKYEEIAPKYNALTDEQKAETNSSGKSVTDMYEMIGTAYNGDGTEDGYGIKDSYGPVCEQLNNWRFWATNNIYWKAQDKFHEVESQLFGNNEEGITGALRKYDEARESGGDLEAALAKIQEGIEEHESAYRKVESVYEKVKTAYKALTDEQKTDKDENDEESRSPEEQLEEIRKNFEIGGIDDKGNEYGGLKANYENNCMELAMQDYYRAQNTYYDATEEFNAARDKAFFGNGNDITGAIEEYHKMANVTEGEEVDLEALATARDNVNTAIEEYESAYSKVDSAYNEAEAAFNALTDEQKNHKDDGVGGDGNPIKSCAEQFSDIQKNYETGGTGTDEDGKEFEYDGIKKQYEDDCNEIDKWRYQDKANLYWPAERAFGEAVQEMNNKRKEYYASVESGNGVDAARDAVKDAISDVTAKYTAAKGCYDDAVKAYGKLTTQKDEQDENGNYYIKDTQEGIENRQADIDDEYNSILSDNGEVGYWAAEDAYLAAEEEFWNAAAELGYNKVDDDFAGGTLGAYDDAVEKDDDVDGARADVQASIDAIAKEYALVGEYYDAAKAAYENLSDEQKDELEESYADIEESKTELESKYKASILPAIEDWKKKDNPGTSTEKPVETPTTSATTSSKSETTSGKSDDSVPAPTENSYNNYIKSIEKTITTAQANSTVKIVTKDSITLTSSVMKTLVNNPTISLYLEYRYMGKDYKVLIPAGQARVVDGIEYYGPLYLYGTYPYDGQTAITGAVVPVTPDAANNAIYTVIKGDTLSKIAKKYNTTIAELLKFNSIKNPNRISIGQKIVVPVK
ncbi:MAG: LysM peptidoglycan-binding domain-containing protein [Clostridiales bacterium]|nr:LysM peptidoglycan-binding domain-containing protein [Clostridiales bacterium]